MNSPTPAIFTVSQLNARARQLLEVSFSGIRVEGEISNLARPASGHWYFTLKDSQAQVRCAMFKGHTALLKFQPKEGDKIEVRGRVSLYENRGDYQLIIDSMKPAGEGALLLAFQQLKERLEREGLFTSEHRQPLPAHIKRVGVVTSATGAAIHDILTVLKRRDPSLEVDIYPSLVQGKEATASIVAAIERANRDNRVDVLIVGRGGGSLEDLWCFNEEAVARAIFASHIPVVSAVGHEVDMSIADFVADLRAATPSAAAELVSQDRALSWHKLEQLQNRLQHACARVQIGVQQQLLQLQQRLHSPSRLIEQRSQQLDQLEARLVRVCRWQQQERSLALNKFTQTLQQQHPKRQLERLAQQLNQYENRLALSQKQQFKTAQQQLNPLPERLQLGLKQQLQQQQQALAAVAKLLHSLSPLSVLARGYSLTQTPASKVIHSANELSAGDTVHTRLQHGWIEATVTASHSPQLSSPTQGELL